MIKKLLSTFAFAVLIANGAQVAAQEGSIALELTADTITLPDSDRGDLVLKACSDCDSREIEVSESTSYEINGIPVHLTVFRAELSAQPKAPLLMQLTPDRRQVARLNLYVGQR